MCLALLVRAESQARPEAIVSCAAKCSWWTPGIVTYRYLVVGVQQQCAVGGVLTAAVINTLHQTGPACKVSCVVAVFSNMQLPSYTLLLETL
jgi:hypothetical protein